MSVRFENPSDTSRNTMAKQTKEGSANKAVSNSSVGVDNADLAKFVSKLQKSQFASLEEFLVTLSPVKRDTIVNSNGQTPI